MRRKIFKIGVICSLLTTIACYTKKEMNNGIVLEKGTLTNIKYLEVTDKGKIYYSDKDDTYILYKGKKEKLDFDILTKIKKQKYGYIARNKNGKVGILNEEFKSVVAFNYDRIINLGETEFIVGENEGKKYLIDIYDYNMLGPYDEIGLTNEGRVIRVTLKDNVEYLDKKGKEIPLLKNKEIFFWRDNTAVIRENGKYGLVDLDTGKVVENTNSEIFFSKNNVLRKENEKYYLNDKEVEIERVYPSINDVVIYDKNGKFGLLNLRDLKYSKETYDEVMFRYNDYMIVGKDGKYGVINKYDEKIPQFKYSYITPAGIDAFAGGSSDETGLAALIVGDKQVTEERYENIYNLVEGYYFGELGGDLILLNKMGEEILKTTRKDIIYYNQNTLVVKDGDNEVVYSLK